MQQKEYQCIVTAVLARHLLKQGFTIVDIKPQKENPDKTVFVFSNSDKLQESIQNYINK